MATIKIHPIQRDYRAEMHHVICGLCGNSTPRTSAHPRVTHLVHLVREHLEEVNRTFTPAGRAEEITIEITG